MLARIKAARDTLRKSEQKVADVVIADPEESVQSSIQAIATRASVSEPTVIRFCRALDCVGFQQFKIKLAQDLARRGTFFYQDVTTSDSSKELANKLLDGAIASLVQIRNQINETALDEAIEMYENCKRVELYGSGGSAVVAEDAQLKFFRLGKPAIAYSDPHIQAAAAALLDKDALVIAISHSGRSSDILKTVDIAREAQARVIAVTATRSPLAQRADVALTVDVNEDSDIFSPVKSRLGQMVVLDVLAVGVAVRGGEHMLEQLSRARRAIDFKFV
ncbi:MurR/RpiR family transcriptional regulator [Granulosicoccus sp. 3-233]|uniref:MurR/RpiR family transcriptional regulator n=1 Tax=Granulosicoccus sp. 3-233 TaxID=3417969 RepID=UPI003D338084